MDGGPMTVAIWIGVLVLVVLVALVVIFRLLVMVSDSDEVDDDPEFPDEGADQSELVERIRW
jgi:hypothetical protein